MNKVTFIAEATGDDLGTYDMASVPVMGDTMIGLPGGTSVVTRRIFSMFAGTWMLYVRKH